MNTHTINKIKHTADTVELVHLLWITLVITSLPIMIVWKPYTYVAVSAILITVGSWVLWGDCPLFTIENRLRRQYNPTESYTGSFISHYLHKHFSIEIPALVFTILGYIYAVLIITLAFLN